MKLPLTCWKHIADYIGKDVRTAQRWEAQLGMPVRRPEPQIVIATPKELDTWIASMPFKGGRLRQLERKPPNTAPEQSSEPLNFSTDIAYCAFDNEVRYLYANDRACDLMERNLTELIGRTIWDVHPGLENSALGRHLINSVKLKRRFKPIRVDHYHPPVNRHFRNIVLPSKQGIENFWRDVTAEKLRSDSNQPRL
jgi:PAS domain-containing protein